MHLESSADLAWPRLHAEVGLAVGGATTLGISLPPWAGLGTSWWQWMTHEGEGTRHCSSALPTFTDISLTEGYVADSKSKRENVAKLHSKGWRMGLSL